MPSATARMARKIGISAGSSVPKTISRMMIATPMPISSEAPCCGCSCTAWPVYAIWTELPAAAAVVASLKSGMTLAGRSQPCPSNWTSTKPTLPSGEMAPLSCVNGSPAPVTRSADFAAAMTFSTVALFCASVSLPSVWKTIVAESPARAGNCFCSRSVAFCASEFGIVNLFCSWPPMVPAAAKMPTMISTQMPIVRHGCAAIERVRRARRPDLVGGVVAVIVDSCEDRGARGVGPLSGISMPYLLQPSLGCADFPPRPLRHGHGVR